MTLPAAAGCISTFETKFAAALAATSAVQTFLGVATSADALARIRYSTFSELPEQENGEYSRSQLESFRPYILIYVPDGQVEFRKLAQNSSSQVSTFVGAVVAILERKIPEAYKADPQAAERDMRNAVGQIAKAVLELCCLSPYPALDEARVDEVCVFTHPDDVAAVGECQTAQITFSRRPSN